MIKYQTGYNPYHKLDVFDEELIKYFEITVTYGSYPLNEDDYIEKVEFSSIQDVFKFIYDDKIRCKELNEPKVYYTLKVCEWCKEDNCYYYDEYEIHFRKKTGKIFTKSI